MARGRHESRAARSRWPLIVGLLSGVLLVALGGAAYAAYRYDRSMEGRILPGIRVAGVDLSGLTREEAIATVRAHTDPDLDREISVRVGGERYTVTARELGRRAWVEAAVARAMRVSEEFGWLERTWRRLRDEPVRREIELRVGGDGGVARFVRRTAREVYVEPTDAAIGLRNGELVFGKGSAGAALDAKRAERLLSAALAEGSSSVRLSMHDVEPKVTPETMGPTIVIDVGTNTLDLYDGFRVDRSWSVATAKPGWITPNGEWTIYRKAENPTWYNPALDSWGAGLPAVIPGGPGNPMGTRALYITAPGLIRIHGTSSPESIGRYASHGCIRMHNEQIEQLYELVPVGTKVIIMGARPAGVVEGDLPDTPDGSDTIA
jgi:L,D-transpeptidase catalytic domain/Putative peptidoglycan binding domain